MATTPKRNYRYPAGTDSPAGATQIQQLATDIDNDVAAIVADTGWVDVVPASGYAVPSGQKAQVRMIRNKVTSRGSLVRSAGAVPVAAETMFTIPSAVLPPPANGTNDLIPLAGAANASANGHIARLVAGSTAVQVAAAGGSNATVYLAAITYLTD